MKEKPKNTALATIPVYNVGGSLNRNSGTRANQNGPEAYGFRGNAQNYDLNRDFIKSDTENAKAFAQLLMLFKLFIHSSPVDTIPMKKLTLFWLTLFLAKKMLTLV